MFSLYTSVVFRASGCCQVSGVHPITAAKVPILKVVDYVTKIKCDILVANREGVSKSNIIYMICSLNERIQKLSFLVHFCNHPYYVEGMLLQIDTKVRQTRKMEIKVVA